jgi:hypothetical protein
MRISGGGRGASSLKSATMRAASATRRASVSGSWSAGSPLPLRRALRRLLLRHPLLRRPLRSPLALRPGVTIGEARGGRMYDMPPLQAIYASDRPTVRPTYSSIHPSVLSAHRSYPPPHRSGAMESPGCSAGSGACCARWRRCCEGARGHGVGGTTLPYPAPRGYPTWAAGGTVPATKHPHIHAEEEGEEGDDDDGSGGEAAEKHGVVFGLGHESGVGGWR